MENQNEVTNNVMDSDNSLVISSQASGYLSETRKWSKFLSILGFIFVGFAVIAAFFMGTVFSTIGAETPGASGMGVGMTVLYLLMAVLYFFPVYYLYKFSGKMKIALLGRKGLDLDEAFKNLKSHYKFVGIMMIVMLCLYPIIAIVAVIGALSGM